MKRARFQAEMNLDDESDLRQRRPQKQFKRPAPPPSTQPQRHTDGFFSSPPELKAQIYSLVLDSDRVDPPSAPLLGDHEGAPGEVRYPAHYKPWRWPLAFWASRTFRNDLIDHAENRLMKRLVRAELDIMVNGFVVYPTWLHLPPDLGGDVPFDLDVSLRIFSGEAFRSNDGWPRQPGAGFRILLRLLCQLIHAGPSFGHRFEILSGKGAFPINTLRVNVTFHDPYTPATSPATSHEIFRMLKVLATSGLAHGIIKTIHVHAEYTPPPPNVAKVTWDRTYPVAARVDDTQTQQWRQMGFLNAHQRTLADDYRPAWDSSSGNHRQRAQKLLSPLHRRDSPVGTIAHVTMNPQQDDYGLISLPTPRSSASRERPVVSGRGKRRSTPMSSHSAGSNGVGNWQWNANANAWVEDCASGALDEYGVVVTPVTSAGTEDEQDLRSA